MCFCRDHPLQLLTDFGVYGLKLQTSATLCHCGYTLPAFRYRDQSCMSQRHKYQTALAK